MTNNPLTEQDIEKEKYLRCPRCGRKKLIHIIDIDEAPGSGH
jgi:hypothetical protein